MNVRIDPLYGEPKPKKYERIHCFTCKLDVLSKGHLVPTHRGHDVHYVNKSGEIDE